jgi:predicted Zn-dependent protease
VKLARLIPLALIVIFATGCSINPVTGKRQLNFYSEQDEIDLGTEADKQIIAQYGILDDPEVQAYVEEIYKLLRGEGYAPEEIRELFKLKRRLQLELKESDGGPGRTEKTFRDFERAVR